MVRASRMDTATSGSAKKVPFIIQPSRRQAASTPTQATSEKTAPMERSGSVAQRWNILCQSEDSERLPAATSTKTSPA